jgi:hypothetical protein
VSSQRGFKPTACLFYIIEMMSAAAASLILALFSPRKSGILPMQATNGN